jgi:predicted ATP-grasp superfamily ATP-dependent carboligase
VKLLITDADARAALAATRALGRRYSVHVAGPERASLAGRSRFAAAHHRVPDPLLAPEDFARAVAALAAKEQIALVLPVTDAATLALIERRGELAPARLAAADARAYARLSDKNALVPLAQQAGLATPRGGLVRDEQGALALAREIGFPVYVKPVVSLVRDAAGRLCKPEVVRVETPETLPAAFERAARGGEALLQQEVSGAGEGLSLLRQRGRTLAAFAHRRLREKPPGGGVSVLSESIAVDPARLAAIESLLDVLGYEGLAMAEFKNDGERAFLIEFNARLWGSLQLAIDAGVDFPGLWVDTLLGHAPAPVRGYASGVRLRWELGDLDHALALARGRRGANGASGIGAALAVLLRPAGPRCRFELLRAEDPRPFGRALARWLARRPD